VATEAIQEGQLFDGRFRILSLLGRGGMGEVWRALDGKTRQKVAIKVLLEKAARKRDLVARFEREAQITGNISSPYICPLLHSGRAGSGELYLVFELIEGESLSDRLKHDPQLGFDEVSAIIDNVLEGLLAAHGAGVVHRDLKPGNIILASEGAARAIILDFGISKLLKRARSSNEASLTTFDATLGSFAYMAPEQVRGAARADERAAVYAVVMGKLGQDPPTLGQTTGDRWPSAVEQFVARSLARHRDARYPSATEALEAWRAVLDRFDQARARCKPLLARLDQPSAA